VLFRSDVNVIVRPLLPSSVNTQHKRLGVTRNTMVNTWTESESAPYTLK